jgi:hypothetical protein
MDSAEERKILQKISDQFHKKYKVPFLLDVQSFYHDFTFVFIEITLPKNEFVRNSTIHVTDEFYKALNKIAAKNNVVLSMNNTGSTLWIDKDKKG